MSRIEGIHHITIIAGDPRENLDFYTGVMGLRLVKKTVNQDVPGTYHLFYTDAEGHPGTDYHRLERLLLKLRQPVPELRINRMLLADHALESILDERSIEFASG